MSLFDLSFAMVMLLVVAALLVWFFRWKAAGSSRRRNAMMAELGVDPANLQTSELIDEVRKRCSRCRSEAECERWLAGKGDGDHSFCPNAGVFDAIRKGEHVTV